MQVFPAGYVGDGSYARVGQSNRFGIGEWGPFSMDFHNDVLYGVGRANRALFSVNKQNGVGTLIGTSGGEFGVGLARPQAIASHKGKLYATGRTNNRSAIGLFELNTANGIGTKVGTDSQFGINEGNVWAMASDGETLFIAGRSTSSLASVNPTTGIATIIAKLTLNGEDHGGGGSMTFDGKDLIMYSFEDKKIYAVNRTTGVMTLKITPNPAINPNQEFSSLAWDGTDLFAAGLEIAWLNKFSR